VALKKPSDFFGNNKTPLDEVKESYDSARPEKIEKVSEAFDAFKLNLNHIQSLSDFTSTFDSFKNNLEKVESVSDEVSEIKEEIKSLIKKEDLDSAMMAQLLFVEESITKIESKISSINGKTVDKIREDFVDLSNSVGSFLNVDVPKYKKLISESEVRFDDRLGVFKQQVEENLDSIKEDVNKEVTSALQTVESVNENTINIVKAEFKETARDVNKNVNELVEKELPKYKKLFAETEVRTEEKVNEVIDTYRQTIEDLNAKVKLFTETEIPKYSNLLVETKLKSEKEVKELEEEVLSKVNALSEKIKFISEGIPEKTSEKIQELKDVTDEYKEEIDSISKKYQALYKDFKNREISENEKLESYSKDIEKYYKRFNFLEETVNEDLREIQNVLIQSNETYHASLKTEVGKFRNKISEQMKDLEMDLTVNEKHIKKQNEHIESIQEEIKEVLERLQLDKLEEKNKELVEKINYLEETISEINEKKLLTEDNPTLPGDPSTNNSSDPLTPLDQKFVTLDQLQSHYRTFINRIQQQIATIGGGGIEDAPNDGQTYSRKGRQWVVAGGGGGSFVTDSVGIHTTKNVGIGSTARSDSALYVDGNATVTGNLSVTGDITYDEATARNWNVTGIATVGTAFYMPQYTTSARDTQTDAGTFDEGAMIYNTTTKKMEFYNGTSWTSLPGMSLGLTVALDG
jgi:DNA repair exonuclease SbcCD ATPase subunit